MSMMAKNNIDPGGGSKTTPSYAKSVKQRTYQKLNRNVLEVSIEKINEEVTLNLKGDQVAQVCEVVGIRVGDETEGYQVKYRGKVITLSVWAKPAVYLERFVTDLPRVFTSDLTITIARFIIIG